MYITFRVQNRNLATAKKSFIGNALKLRNHASG
jgi:hypothetical protein